MIDPFKAAPDQMNAWLRSAMLINSSLDPKLAQLIEIRASQINGCASCINLHTAAARESGETEQRLYLLAAWREALCFTARERAALGWTDSLTRLCDEPDIEQAYETLRAHFDEEEQIKITLVINVINGFNRLAVGFGLWADPGAVKAKAASMAA